LDLAFVQFAARKWTISGDKHVNKKKILIVLAVTFGLIVISTLAVGVYSSVISRPLFDDTLAIETLDTIEIADPRDALTFARYREDDSLRVLLVRSYKEATVEGINLNDYFDTDQIDPIQLFNMYGYDRISNAVSSDTVSVSAMELEIPFEAKGQHIGIGANYRAHAIESGAGDEPFVFPKLADATHFKSAISVHDSPRLDYEAELGLVVLNDISSGTAFPEFMGLVLCNDFTDRWTLVRQMDMKAPMGTTGFPDGKGKKGFLPIGNLFLIPRDLKEFYPNVELTLYLNGQLRQRAEAGLMIWDPPEILRKIFFRSRWVFHSDRGKIFLLPDAESISAGTIILSGTPEGVIFRIANIWNPSLYLAAGEEVVMRSERLGILRSAIVE
jgi:2-keto-4-pentenoate hydratase/2-oxohepta-3-ene-1,7-dioic acid hydratase in catechol pathway